MARLITRSRLALTAAAFVAVQCVTRLATIDYYQKSTKDHQSEDLREWKEKIIHANSLSTTTQTIGGTRYTKRGAGNSNSSKCLDEDFDWSVEVRPKYQMNPKEFLISTLLNGPNNQMMGFQQSMLLALLLNRTLVVPKFYEHKIDKFFRSFVPVEHRLNVQKIRKFISVVPMETAVKLCEGKINAIFASKSGVSVRNSLHKLVRIYIETGLSGVKFVDEVGDAEIEAIKEYLYDEQQRPIDEELRSKNWWPKNKTEHIWMHKILSKGGQDIEILPPERASTYIGDARTQYRTDAKCALYWFPFRQYNFKKMDEGMINAIETVNMHKFDPSMGWKLYSDILQNTMPPDTIITWSKKFQSRYLRSGNGNYLSVHWRFDKEDFFSYICKEKKVGRQEFCNGVRRATNSTAIAIGILTKIAQLKEFFNAKISTVYLAAPPTLNNLLERIVAEISNFKKVKSSLTSGITIPPVYTSKHLRKLILQNYRSCRMASAKQISDTISQIEMDICASGYSFMWSRQSTWSSNVKRKRLFNRLSSRNKVDSSALDVVLRTMDVNPVELG